MPSPRIKDYLKKDKPRPGFPSVPTSAYPRPEQQHEVIRTLAPDPRTRNGLKAWRDWLRKPSELEWSDGVLELILENQGVWRVGLCKEDLPLPDPTLWSYDREKYDM